jgi:hypothetical protein
MTVSSGTACKGCSTTVRLSPREAEAAFERLRLPPGTPLAAPVVYEQRMGVCAGCAELEYGTTCRQCGCLIQIRGRLAADGCPHPGGSRWRRAAMAEA